MFAIDEVIFNRQTSAWHNHPHSLCGVSWQVIHESVAAEDGRGSTEVSYFLDGAHTAESMLTCARWFTDAANEQAADFESSTGTKGELGTQRVLVFNCTQVWLVAHYYIQTACELYCTETF